MSFQHVLVLTLIALLLGVRLAVAQSGLTSAEIRGVVTDPLGGVIAGSHITVTHLDTNVSRNVATDPNGRYTVPALPPGRYRLTATAAGFRTETRVGVGLSIGDSINIDVMLTTLTTELGITVNATPPSIEPSHTAVSTVVGQEQIENLPINGRNFMTFAAITAGAALDRTPQQGATTTSGLSFTGQRARSNNIMIDGFDNNDNVVGATRLRTSQEAVREFRVLTDSFSAEFGRASGGVVNIVTKSGTNDFHGNTFMFVRDRSLNSRSYFEKFDIFGTPVALDKAPFDQQQLGATFGGPLRRNRSFFFGSHERNTTNASRFVTIDPVAATALHSRGFPVETGHVPLDVSSSDWFGKIDAQITPAHAVVFRAGANSSIDREGIDDFGGIVARSRGTTQVRSDWSIAASDTAVIGSRVVHELRFQYAYERQRIEALDPGCDGPCDRLETGGPTLELSGVASVGRQRLTPQTRLNRRVELSDTFMYLRGEHEWKLGLSFNHIASPGHGNQLPLHFGGRYIFTTIPALGVRSSLDGFEKGIPAVYIQGYGNPVYPSVGYADLAVFVQEQWRHRGWVIKPGVRYQRQFWQPHTYSVSDVGGTTFSYPLRSDGDNVAPRLGVGRALTADGSTVLHAAYGMYFDNIVSAIPSAGRVIDGSADGVRTLVLSAPRAALAWSTPSHRLSEAQATALLGAPYPSSVITVDPDLKTSYTHQVSAGIDRRVPGNVVVSANVMYVRGFNLPGALDYNPVLPARLGPGRRPNDHPCSSNTLATCVNGGIPGSSASVLQYTAYGETWYKGVTASLARRFRGSLQFSVVYTLSKAEDTSTDFQTNFVPEVNGFGRNPQDPFGLPIGFDPRAERGLATQDQRHRFVLSGIYNLPRAFQLSAIMAAGSGQPFSPLAGADLNGDGDAGGFPSDRARENPADASTSVARNSERTAAQFTIDVRVSRRFTVRNRFTLDTIVEAFNLLNRANFVEDTNQSSFVVFGSDTFPVNPLPTYGKYTQALPPRQIQIAAKFGF